jgi:hypothetical protein
MPGHEKAKPCRPVQKTTVLETHQKNQKKLSFSEDDCTRQRGLKAVVQSSIERTVSGVRCTNDDLKPVLVALATDQPLDGDGRENGQNRTLSMRPVRLRP